ncbi:MAG: hypothetical protein WA364_12765 [Candidatus Nitrosopolaris sp.]
MNTKASVILAILGIAISRVRLSLRGVTWYIYSKKSLVEWIDVHGNRN